MSKGKVFTAQEVQSILSGNKTMFREVIKNKTSFEDFLQTREVGDNWYKDRTISMRGQGGLWGDYTLERFVEKFCPYQVGQKIFVKESFNIFAGQVAYKQSLANAERYIWKPAQHMKQEHSRLTLLIKEIRVERLADISEEDAIAEGMFFTDYGKNCYGQQEAGWSWKKNKSFSECLGSAYWAFANKWNATHKKPEAKFEANPWVWSIQFEVVK
jgi:hypothetical protein